MKKLFVAIALVLLLAIWLACGGGTSGVTQLDGSWTITVSATNPGYSHSAVFRVNLVSGPCTIQTAAGVFGEDDTYCFIADNEGHGSISETGSFFYPPQAVVVSNRIGGYGTLFVHALAGANRISTSTTGLSASDTSFAMAFGGGADINATRRVSVRLVQIDYLFTKHGTAPMNIQNNVRVSAGVVFQLGGYK